VDGDNGGGDAVSAAGDAGNAGDDASDDGPQGTYIETSRCSGQGAPAIPAGFPSLGASCRAHFTYHEDVIDTTNQFGTVSNDRDYAASQGVRPFSDPPAPGLEAGAPWSGFDLGVYDKPDIPIALIVPALTPAVYVREDGADVVTGDLGGITSYDADSWCGYARIQIVGRSSDAIWGTFTSDGYDPQDVTDSHVTNGMFSAVIETVPSAVSLTGASCGRGCGTPDPISCPKAPPCNTAADCPTPSATCVVPDCVLIPAWSGGNGYCTNTPTDSQCPAQQLCTYQQGCLPK
jgi:hypothetical protein